MMVRRGYVVGDLCRRRSSVVASKPRQRGRSHACRRGNARMLQGSNPRPDQSGKSADFLRRRPPVGQRCTMPRLTESNKRILGALLLVAGSATSMTSSASMLALHLGLGALASRGVSRQIEVKTPPRRLPSSDRTLPRSACESLRTSRGGSGSLSV